MSNTTPPYYPKYEIWSKENNLWDFNFSYIDSVCQDWQDRPSSLPAELHCVQRGLLDQLLPGGQHLPLEWSQAQWRKALGLDIKLLKLQKHFCGMSEEQLSLERSRTFSETLALYPTALKHSVESWFSFPGRFTVVLLLLVNVSLACDIWHFKGFIVMDKVL